MKVYLVTQELFDAAPWKDDLIRAVDDYLVRSNEEIALEEVWDVLKLAMAGKGGLSLAAAIDDDDEYVLGYALFRHLDGLPSTGNTLMIWQVYAWPGRIRLTEMWEYALRALVPRVQQAMKAQGRPPYSRVQIYTRRDSPAYRKLLGRLGFYPDGTTYLRSLQ